MSLQLALQFLAQGNFAAAEPPAAATVQKEPFNPVCHAVHGTALLGVGHLTLAEQRFRTALDLGLAEPEKAWLNLGKTYVEMNRDQDAIAAFDKALELKPDYTAALVDIGNPLCREGLAQSDISLIDRAIANYRGLKKRSPKTPNLEVALLKALKVKAAFLIEQGDEKDAVKLLKAPLQRSLDQNAARLILKTRKRLAEDLTGPQPFRDCTILPGDKEWFFFSGNDVFFHDMANANPEVSPYLAAFGPSKALLALPRKCLSFDQAYLLGGSTNYYHWLLDYFPRLRHLEETSNFDDLPILINDPLTGFQKQCLALAGISEDRLAPVAMPNRITVEKLVAAPVATRKQVPEPETLPWLRKIFGIQAAQEPKRRLYISRSDASVRRVVNENEVIDFLKPLGFDVITPGEMRVHEQALAFSEAQTIVGPHGAALTNMVFAPKGCQIIEFLGGLRFRQGFFDRLSKSGEQSFTQLTCVSQGTADQRLTVNEQDFDMHVPIPALKEALKDLSVA